MGFRRFLNRVAKAEPPATLTELAELEPEPAPTPYPAFSRRRLDRAHGPDNARPPQFGSCQVAGCSARGLEHHDFSRRAAPEALTCRTDLTPWRRRWAICGRVARFNSSFCVF
jgi:hypothetical protein